MLGRIAALEKRVQELEGRALDARVSVLENAQLWKPPVNAIGKFIDEQQPLPPEFRKVLNDNYWELLEGSDLPHPPLSPH
jgi:hypothetical protein